MFRKFDTEFTYLVCSVEKNASGAG